MRGSTKLRRKNRSIEKDRVFEEIEEISPTYPDSNRNLKLWQSAPAPAKEPRCKLCHWAINSYLKKKKVEKLLSVASERLEEINEKMAEYAIKKVKRKLKNEFREGEDYKICRFDIFKLAREEAEFYLRKKGHSYEELKEKFKEYTRQFLLLYDWDIPEGGAGGNPL